MLPENDMQRVQSAPSIPLVVAVNLVALAGDTPDPSARPVRGYRIPLIDLASQKDRQVILDKEAGQYLGHPTTVLLEDGQTMIAVYPKGHGRGAIVMKRSS